MTGSPSTPAGQQRLATRVASITPSATLAVDAKAKALKAQGENVIGFGAGEPDFATPDYIVDAAQKACADPANHRYSPAAGLPALREAIAHKTLRDSAVEVTPQQVVVTNGGKHAVYSAFSILLNPGDEVLLPAPFWTTYPEPIRLAGATPVVVDTTEETEFRVSVDQLEAARTDKTKAIVFVSPSNPTGSVYPAEETKAIGEWALEHGIYVITDEIYEHLVYGSAQHHSILSLVPELAEQTIILNGVAKTYAMTGWRVGWLIAPADFAAGATNLQSHVTSNVCNVAQAAALAAVSGDLSAVDEMRAVFDRRRQIMHQMLNEIQGVNCVEPLGAFYAYPSFKQLLGQSFGGRTIDTTIDLADVVLEQAKVAFVPGEAFGTPGYGRFSFALGDDDLVEGLERLSEFLSRRD